MICTKCNNDLPKESFNLNTRCLWCKICRSRYDKQYYKDRKDKLYTQKVNRIYNIREIVSKLKAQCSKCKENHPGCLVFHHIDKSQKEFTISDATKNGWSLKRILKEIEKCDILCANCHSILHWEEKHGCYIK